MIAVKIIAVIAAFLVVAWIIANIVEWHFDAGMARRLCDFSIKTSESQEKRNAYAALNARIHSEASSGMDYTTVYVKREYADLFEARLKRRGFKVEQIDEYKLSSTIRFVVSW